MSLTKEEKKVLLRAYWEAQAKTYLLNKADAESLFEYVDRQLAENGCDQTLRHTEVWLAENYKDENIQQQILDEIREDGGYCDCEVILNCYEEYELDF